MPRNAFKSKCLAKLNPNRYVQQNYIMDLFRGIILQQHINQTTVRENINFFILFPRNLVIALKELSIRGDFRTTVEYLITLLETPSFQENNIDTSWLDALIAERVCYIVCLTTLWRSQVRSPLIGCTVCPFSGPPDTGKILSVFLWVKK